MTYDKNWLYRAHGIENITQDHIIRRIKGARISIQRTHLPKHINDDIDISHSNIIKHLAEIMNIYGDHPK